MHDAVAARDVDVPAGETAEAERTGNEMLRSRGCGKAHGWCKRRHASPAQIRLEEDVGPVSLDRADELVARVGKANRGTRAHRSGNIRTRDKRVQEGRVDWRSRCYCKRRGSQ